MCGGTRANMVHSSLMVACKANISSDGLADHELCFLEQTR